MKPGSIRCCAALLIWQRAAHPTLGNILLRDIELSEHVLVKWVINIQLHPVQTNHTLLELLRKFTVHHGPAGLGIHFGNDRIRAAAGFGIVIRADRPAAVGYALFARRIQLGQTGNPSVYQREALEALARQFSVSGGYVKDGESWRASPQLVNAINARLGEGTVPADGRFSVEDFRAAADLKSLSPIVATVQEKHFSTLEK